MTLKTILSHVAVAAIFYLVAYGVMVLLQLASASLTEIKVKEVRPGVECVVITTVVGAATDCWYTP